MPQTCKLCKHPKRKQVKDWIAEGQSNRFIADRTGVGINSVQRHREHIKILVAKAREKEGIAFGKSAYDRFMDVLDEAEKKYRKAENPMLEVAWFREWRGMMELGFKLGMEAAREHRFKDMSPPVARLIEEITKSLQPES